jgi:intein/homing endonuclease
MTTKEKVINESIIRVEKSLKELKKINEATPLLDLIKIREEAQKLLDDNKTIQQRTSNDFIAKIDLLSKKEKRCIKLAKELTGQKMLDLMDEQIKLEFELRDLNNEKYYIERSRIS